MVQPGGVVAPRVVETLVVETPAGLRAGQGGPRGHLRAVADEAHLRAAHQLVRGAGAHRGDVVPHPLEGLQCQRQPGAGLGRGHVVVHEAPQLVLDLGLRRAVRIAQRTVDQLVRLPELVEGQRPLVRRVLGRVRTGQVPEDERADHVVVRDAGQVAGGIQARDGGPGVVVDPYARGRVAAAQADLGDVHLDVVGAVVVAAAGVEGAARRAFRRVQDRLQRRDRLLRQVTELQVHRPPVAGHLGRELRHHVARPVVGVHEPFAVPVDLIAAEGIGDVGAGRAVVVLDERIDLEALDAGELRARVIGHRVAVTRVRRVLVRAVQIARRGKAETPAGTGRQDHGTRPDGDEGARARVEAGRAHGPPPGREHADRHHPVLDPDPLAHLAPAQLPVQDLLDVLALGHRQHVRAGAVDLPDRVRAVLVLLELHPVRLQPAHHREAAGGGLPDGALVDDAVVGTGDLGDVVVRLRAARDDRVVDAVHAHGERARVTDVRLLQQQHVRAVLGGRQGGHGAGGAAADHEDVAGHFLGVGEVRDPQGGVHQRAFHEACLSGSVPFRHRVR